MGSEAPADRAFVGSIPDIYDRLLVPLIFAPYARDLAERAARLSPARTLETAAGTGVLTRALRERLAPDAEIVATDLNTPMLEVAKRLCETSREGEQPVLWQQADALALPFPDAHFDLVACQFGAMFFSDHSHGYAEARRVLRRGGTFLFNVWGTLADNHISAEAMAALARLYPADPPSFLARLPHGYADADRIRSDLLAAGFETVEIETLDFVARAPSAMDAATGICQGTPMRSEIEARADAGPSLDDATRMVAEALTARFGADPLEGQIRALVVSAPR